MFPWNEFDGKQTGMVKCNPARDMKLFRHNFLKYL